MNALKPRKGFVQDELNIERLTPIQWDGIMRAMQNYAKHYHETMQENDFEKPQEQCTIPVVISRCFDKLEKEIGANKEDMVVRINYKDNEPQEIIVEDMLCSVLGTIDFNGL